MSLRHSCVRPAIRTGNFGVQGREARVVLAPLERDGLCSDALSDDLRLHAGPRSITARAEPVHDDCGAGIVATAQWKFAGMHDPAAMPRSRGQDAACLTGAAAPRPKPMWLAVWCCRAPCGQHVTSSAGAGFVLRSCRRCDPVRVAFPVPLSRSPRGVGAGGGSVPMHRFWCRPAILILPHRRRFTPARGRCGGTGPMTGLPVPASTRTVAQSKAPHHR